MIRGGIGGADERRPARRVTRKHRDPDAARNRHRVLLEHVWVAQRREQFPRHDLPSLSPFQLRQDHGKLVSAQAGHGVFGSRDLGQPVSHRLEQQIANCVAETVVDGFETVDVDIENAQLPAAPLRMRECLCETVVEELPVRQTSERIVMGQMEEPAMFPLGDATRQAVPGADAEIEAIKFTIDRCARRAPARCALVNT